jgi:hypothetical protein
MRNLKSYKILFIFFFLQFLGAHFAMAQLSSKHYLPPLKRSGGSSEFAGQAFYLSTPETSAFDVHVYQGTNTTPVAILSISNTSSGKYEPTLGTGGFVAYGSNNTSFVTDAYAGIVLSSAGFRFEAPGGQEFYVNWRASHSAQAASLVSAGEAGLGTDFKWGGSPLVDIMSGSFSGSAYQNHVNSVIGIMATEDNTTVTISGYDAGCTFTNASGQNGITADVINITLNAGQSYVLEARPTGLTYATSPNNQGWLGATISSNKKIALNQGHLLLSFNTGNLDMSMTQITPTTNIGKEYVFIRGLGGDKPEFPVIIATENNTEVYVNNETTPFATLNDGQWIKIPSTKYSQSGTSGGFQGANMYIRATKNVYAFQTLDAGSNNDFPANADVFQVAPLNCLLDNGVNNITNIVETGNATYNTLSTIYLMIMASSAINANDIVIKYGVGSANTIPSSTISTARKTVLGTSDWVTYFVQIPAPQGDVSVYAPGPVAVAYLAYSGAVGVAGYFSGFGSIPTIDVETTGDGCFPNTTLTATPGFTSYAWYKDGVLMPSVTTNSFTPTIAGDYYVEVFRGACSYPSATKTVYDCNPEVVVRNTASKKYLLPGETTTFTITVKMLGGSAAQNMQISNVLPAHLTYTSSTLTTGTFTGSGSNYTWNVGTMTNGQENTLNVVATAQAVTSAYAETYTVNNTQTFGLGTETNNLADDKTEDVVIYPACSNTLAGTIFGAASYCSTTNTTTLTASDAFGDLEWQSSTDNSIFTDIGSATTATLLITNLASTTYYRMKATVDTCVAYSPSVTITVTQGPTGTLSSATGTNAQSLCENTALTTITYSTSNATGATFSGLPDGVTGSYASNVVTISGTPTATGTFSYTVTLAGSCDVTLTGSIIVSNTNNTISLTSASGTDAQSIDNNVAITSITYNTTGATGATISGLPTGITGTWSNNNISINGTPTTSGVYNYTISLTGGCGSVSTTGTITVKGVTITSNISGSSICAGTSVTFNATAIGFTSPTYQWYKNNVAISGATSSTYSTTSLANNDIINVSCSTVSNIVNDNTLALCLDAGNATSYSGTGTTWYDISGNNKNATLTSDQSFSSGEGGSIQFNGGQNAVSIPLASANTTNVTIQTWVYLDANTKGPFFKNGTNNGYLFGTGSGGHEFGVGNKATMLFAGARWITTTTNFGYGWKLVTMVINSSGVPSLYINNTLVPGTYTGNNALTPTTGTYLGRNVGDDDVNWPKFNGKMASVYFYTKALSQSEINQNYDALATRFGFSSSNSIVSNTISITISALPVSTIIVSGDGCINKTTLSTTSGLTSYTWYKDNVVISGAITNSYSPSTAGDYKVMVSNGTCSNTSPTTTISVCGLTAEGKMIPVLNSTTLVSKEGAINNGKGIDERGLILTKPMVYGTVTSSSTGRIWMDRNLGASRVATAANDTESYGDLFQWGRKADGHEKNRSYSEEYFTASTTTKLTSTQEVSNKYVISDNGNYEWTTNWDVTEPWATDATYIGGINNPCPNGFRVPTYAELEAERPDLAGLSSPLTIDAFANSFLKIPGGGYWHQSAKGELSGSLFALWSSTPSNDGLKGKVLRFYNGNLNWREPPKGDGYCVRCIKD